ncbi:sirohydrochlorin chelatase [Streptomyces cacaoi]|uniref:Sirohydrochlorin chelatase n=1 Tax=Streptomyces cacaoi TaxID=1898 RepID=A0A4Y3R8Z1_STRCI|nr:sirohydrochlorin chelatase [Streptomyces cacaoi]NNG86267.1 sirohydrochlorin chelatase [Streptomyces cacaoi]GEB53278.1 sirohydrochlorin chelatase [Streptomyces cacaoi]
MHRPALVLVAHGSRDPRHEATVRALGARVRALLPDVRTEIAHLDFNTPDLAGALRQLYRDGVREVVAVPLLLTRAYHAKTDIPAALAEAAAALPGLRVHRADVLGPHPLLTRALERRLAEARVTAPQARETGIVLAAAGSSDPEAIAVIAEIAREWRHTSGWCAVRPAFASASLPTTEDAVRELRDSGVRRVAVARYVVAPGFLPDRIARGAWDGGADVVAPVLGDAVEVARVVALRYGRASAPLVLSSAAA